MPWQIKFYFCTKIKSYITVIYYLPVMLKIYFPINCYLSNHIVFYFDSKTTVCQCKFKLLWAISKYRYSDIPLIRRHYRVFRYDTIYRYIDITSSKWALVASAGHLQWRRIRKEVGKSQATIVASRRAVDATDDTTCGPIESEALTCQ